MDPRLVLRELTSLEADAQLEALEAVVRNLTSPDVTGPLVDDLFRLLERFPFEESFGLFGAIMHALERVPGVETAVVGSVCRSPGYTNLAMVNRLLNGGVVQVAGVDLLTLLTEVATSAELEEARRVATEYLAFHGPQGD